MKLHTFFLAPRHAGPIGLLANGQVKVRTGIVQHCQWALSLRRKSCELEAEGERTHL